jgi:hypothetical protein
VSPVERLPVMNDRCDHPPIRYSICDGVYSQSLAGEAVLLDVATGTYWGLDEVGTRIWELLGQGETVEGIAATLSSEYDAEPATLERDARAFVESLAAQGLVHPESDST